MAYLLALLTVAEGLVRLSGVASRHVPDRVYRPGAAGVAYAHKPNLRSVRGWNDTIFDTDALGLRSRHGDEPVGPKHPGEYRVALVGDSVTFGEGVATPETFAALAADRLAGTGTRVFNFGVSGYSVREIAATVAQRVAAVAPDLVLIVLIPADFDLWRTGTVDAWGSIRPSGGSDRLEWLKVPLRRLHVAYALLDLARGRRPGWSSSPIVGVPGSWDYVAALPSTCRARGFACGLVLLSTKIDDGFGPTAELLRELGMPMLDLTTLPAAFTVSDFNAGPYDPHPSPAVHRRVADALVPWIAERRAAARP